MLIVSNQTYKPLSKLPKPCLWAQILHFYN
jgi:hypothetical protein